jgi:DNA gyrase subunit B
MGDSDIFKIMEFDFATLEHRVPFWNSGVHILLVDDRYDENTEVEFCYDGGVSPIPRHLKTTRDAKIQVQRR